LSSWQWKEPDRDEPACPFDTTPDRYEKCRSIGVEETMPLNAESRMPASLIDDIAEKIHARIIAGVYKPGVRLKQESLAEEFGVSRTPIREALSRLDARGIVKQEVGRSAIICTPDPREVREMYQVRAELEGLAAQLAAQWISDDQLRRLRLTHDAFVKATKRLRASKAPRVQTTAGDSAMQAALGWSDTNADFHRTIMEASGNASLLRILKGVSAGYFQNIILTSAAEMTMHRVTTNIESHSKILSAIEDRDSARARQAMTEHILEGGVFVTAWFERQNFN
jgi:DNA-binding GntR family transcriptional regulator